MALRFRRFLTSLPSTLHRTISVPPTTPSPVPLPGPALSTLRSPNPVGRSPLRFFSEGGRQFKLYKEGDEITEDTVLFEGCDFNHWLITVDFPKDPKPSPEEMVATYERICAQGLNISIEEAKKRMYACSSTTYQGFQAIMTEAESEKFTNVPGVVFVLPDSYIDPVNKEYGGDKYENGVITPRPPPYVPQRRDRRPRFDQPRNARYDQPRISQNYPREYQSPQYNREMPMQGNPNNFGPPQNFPRQDPSNVGPPPNLPRQDPNNFGPPQNFPRQDPNNFGPPQKFPRQDPGFPERRDHVPLHNVPTQQNFIPPLQERDMPTSNRNFAPRGWDNNQVNGGGPTPPFQSNSNYQPPDQRGFPRGGNQLHNGSQEQAFARDSRNYAPPGGSDCQDGYVQAYPKEGFSQMEQQENTQPGVRRV